MSGVRVGSAVLVLDESNRVLLGRRAKTPNYGRWVLPGGKIESFETIDAAGRREVREETGLDVEIVQQLGVFEIIDPPLEHRLIVFSIGRVQAGTLAAGADLSEACFFSASELPKLDLTETTIRVLEKAGVIDAEAGLLSA